MAAKHGQNAGVGGTLQFMSDARIRNFHRLDDHDDPIPPVSKADDVFAFGCIMLELLGGKEEFHAWNRNRREFLEDGKNEPEDNALMFPPRIRRAHKKSLIDLLQRCVDEDPTQRPPIEELEREIMEASIPQASVRRLRTRAASPPPPPPALCRPKRKLVKKVNDQNAFPIALRLRRRRILHQGCTRGCTQQ